MLSASPSEATDDAMEPMPVSDVPPSAAGHTPVVLSAATLRRTIAAAVRRNAVPGMCLWAVALTCLLLYYLSDGAQDAFDEVGELKTEYGFLFSFVVTALSGGLVPFLVVLGRDGCPSVMWVVRHASFYMLFWGYKGVEVDGLYRAQAALFGDDPSLTITAAKIAVDQFVYSPIWGVVSTLWPSMFEQLDFDVAEFRSRLDREMFYVTMPTTLVAAWCVWLPVVCCVYSLPSPLQIPMFNLANVFWVLLLVFISPKKRIPPPSTPLVGPLVVDPTAPTAIRKDEHVLDPLIDDAAMSTPPLERVEPESIHLQENNNC